ncbi:MAG TPA: hypothetical protein VGC11_13185 [Acidimicrobiia bacterium]
MATPCPQILLPRKVEELGTVDAVDLRNPGEEPRLDVTFRPDDGILGDSDRAEVRAMLQAGDNFRIFRVTEYVFDSETEECVSILKFRRCQYQQRYDIIVGGRIISTTEVKGLQPGDRELIGICPEKLIELLLSKATALVPSPAGLLSDAGAAVEPRPETALAALLAPLISGALPPVAATTKRISRPALAAVLAQGVGGTDVASSLIDTLESVGAGDAELTRVAIEVERRPNELDPVTIGVLRALATTPIRLGDGIGSDDAFLVVATSLRRTLGEG